MLPYEIIYFLSYQLPFLVDFPLQSLIPKGVPDFPSCDTWQSFQGPEPRAVPSAEARGEIFLLNIFPWIFPMNPWGFPQQKIWGFLGLFNVVFGPWFQMV